VIAGAAYGSVSDIEVAWVLIALVGAVFAFFNLREAHNDKVRLRRLGIANGRHLLARTNFIAESTRLTKQIIFAVIGLLAFFVPEAPDTLDLPAVQAAIRFAITWGLILASVLTTYQSYLAFKVRRELTRGGE
jgi:hypothetical protein